MSQLTPPCGPHIQTHTDTVHAHVGCVQTGNLGLGGPGLPLSALLCSGALTVQRGVAPGPVNPTASDLSTRPLCSIHPLWLGTTSFSLLDPPMFPHDQFCLDPE